MALLTTALTTAFMPALSPPEVSTAIFILHCGGGGAVMVVAESVGRAVLDDGDGVCEEDAKLEASRPSRPEVASLGCDWLLAKPD